MKRLLILILLVFFNINLFSQDENWIEKNGFYCGLNLGTWMPDGKNKVLGNPFLIGFTIDLKPSKNSYALNFDLIGWPNGKTVDPFQVKFEDTVLTRRDYFGAQLTFDYCRELFETKRLVFEVMSGIGYGELTYYNPDIVIDIDKGSLVFSPGISIRYLIGKKTFLQWKNQYCMANYNLGDGVSTNLKGNYLTTKLIVGSR